MSLWPKPRVSLSRTFVNTLRQVKTASNEADGLAREKLLDLALSVNERRLTCQMGTRSHSVTALHMSALRAPQIEVVGKRSPMYPKNHSTEAILSPRSATPANPKFDPETIQNRYLEGSPWGVGSCRSVMTTLSLIGLVLAALFAGDRKSNV